MIIINSVSLIGRSVREVEMKYTQSGMPIVNVTMAVDRQMSKAKKEEAEKNNQPTSDFIRIVAFNHTAEFLGNYLGKGKMFAVSGRIQTGSYDDKDGKRIYATDVIANNVKIIEWPEDNQNKGKKQSYDDIEGFSPADNEESIPF